MTREEIDAINKHKNDLGIMAPDIEYTAPDEIIRDFQTVIEVVSKHELAFPSEYQAEYLTFVASVRDLVWRQSKDAQDRFFKGAEARLWQLKDEGLSARDARTRLFSEYDPRRYDWEAVKGK
jgi:hypothetical protein